MPIKKKIIDGIVNTTKTSEKCRILFICSLRSKTSGTEDYEDFSISSEYYSDNVFEKISETIRQLGYEMLVFYNEEEFIKWAINNKNPHKTDIVISSAQKGIKIGRKSLIPAFCDLYGIGYVGSNPYVNSLCRDKYRSGCVLEQNGIPVPKSFLYSSDFGWRPNDSIKNLETELIAKPNYESSSIGIDEKNISVFNKDFENKIKHLNNSMQQEIAVQEFVEGYEVEVPIICSNTKIALLPVGIKMGNEANLESRILNYDVRRKNEYTFYNFVDLDPLLALQLEKTAESVCEILGIHGFGRVDFRITKDKRFFVTDVACNPHYTEQSSFYFPFKKLGMTYEDMIACLIATYYLKGSAA